MIHPLFVLQMLANEIARRYTINGVNCYPDKAAGRVGRPGDRRGSNSAPSLTGWRGAKRCQRLCPVYI
jgi:hypothetical protein